MGTHTSPRLFEQLQLRDLTIPHRLWVAPMCQFSSGDHSGIPNHWHLVHLGSFAVGRAGLIVAEATAVTPDGRIAPEDTGIWSDEHTAAWKPITEFVHSQGVPIALQLSHAGRKASMGSRFERKGPIPKEEGGWSTKGPSELGYGDLPLPRALTIREIHEIIDEFAEGAARAVEAGFDAIEIHGAHGYLLHEFLSPLSNVRDDEYGGSFENRIRFLIEVVTRVRATMPAGMPLMIRLSVTDWVEGGWDLEQTQQLVPVLEALGVDFFSISSGGNDLRQDIPVRPGYQVPFARAIRKVATVPVGVAGLIQSSQQAETLLVDDAADVIFAAREFLRDSKFALRAAAELGGFLEWPKPYGVAKYEGSIP